MKGLSLFCIFIGSLAFGQADFNKETDFLRNYKAPDFKLRRLDVLFNSSGGASSVGIGNNRDFRSAAGLRYSQYANSQKYQGSLAAGFSSSVAWQKSAFNESFDFRAAADLTTENRFYFKPRWFIGVHGNVSASYFYNNQDSMPATDNFLRGINPVFSIGNGRLEPIQYARNAMDIERLLKKNNRLKKDYSKEEITRLADRIAEINNVRFYDRRFRRIEQLEELDETMQEIGGISEFDIRYFAQLADAYLYANYFLRSSGFRQEIGFTPVAGFYELNYDLAQSYAIQHNFSASAVGGFAHNWNLPAPNENEANFWVTTGYELAMYPTTRTNFNIGAQIGSALIEPAPVGRFFTNGAIWFSPQLRLNFNAELVLGQSASIASGINGLINSNVFNVNGPTVNGRIGLAYAIF